MLAVGGHYQGKGETVALERNNGQQRHWTAALRRRSIVVSKTKRRVDVSLALFARLAEGVFDPAEVTRRTHALADFIVAATKHYNIDRTRLIAVGFGEAAPAVNNAAVVIDPTAHVFPGHSSEA